MFRLIEKFLKSFFRQVANLSQRDQAEISRLIIFAVALVSQAMLFIWVLDKAK